MKILRTLTVILFLLVLLIPVFMFNFEEDAISEIDNRQLQANPFLPEELSQGDLTENIENYVNDRIGLRDEMILGYTVLNDRIFGKMVHPIYSYGKEGYVFAGGLESVEYGEYHEVFAEMIKEIQDYCQERSVPFVFVFEPAKPAVLEEYIHDGINYDRSWVEKFFEKLDELGVSYVDNTTVLKEKTDEGEKVFNQKYDANHWNALGAFYGTEQVLNALSQQIDGIHITSTSELEIDEQLQTSLLVSEFPINEKVPVINIENLNYMSIGNEFSGELYLNDNYRGFDYLQNPTRKSEGAPKALVFQGSYMNGLGWPFFANAFSEYIYIHDYQNVIDFQYYFNIFKPDCVVFEVAEYTLNNGYFDFERMKAMDLNENLDTMMAKAKEISEEYLVPEDVIVETGNQLTRVFWKSEESFENVWLVLGDEYDFQVQDGGYTVTVLTEEYERYKDSMKIVYQKGDSIHELSSVIS